MVFQLILATIPAGILSSTVAAEVTTPPLEQLLRNNNWLSARGVVERPMADLAYAKRTPEVYSDDLSHRLTFGYREQGVGVTPDRLVDEIVTHVALA